MDFEKCKPEDFKFKNQEKSIDMENLQHAYCVKGNPKFGGSFISKNVDLAHIIFDSCSDKKLKCWDK